MIGDVDAAIAKVRAAAEAARDSEREYRRAMSNRRDVAHKVWPRIYRLGQTRIADEVGDSINMPTLRSVTRDCRPRPAKGPRVDATYGPKQKEAIDELRAACERLVQAKKDRKDALNSRYFTIREQWPVLAPLGAAYVARSVGAGIVGESTIRQAVDDLQRAQG